MDVTLSEPIDRTDRGHLMRWLRARLDEDEAAVREMSCGDGDRLRYLRAVREIYARRVLLASYEDAARVYDQAAAVVAGADGSRAADDVLAYETARAAALALDGAVRLAAYPYQGHRGYLEAWRP